MRTDNLQKRIDSHRRKIARLQQKRLYIQSLGLRGALYLTNKGVV